MKYRITGTDAETGEERTIVVEAASENEAVALAKSQGVFANQVAKARGCPRCGKPVSVLGRDLISGLCAACAAAEQRAQEQRATKRARKRSRQALEDLVSNLLAAHGVSATSETEPLPVRYSYKMIQVPPTLVVEESGQTRTVAAAFLELLVSEMALAGWDFYRVDTVGIRVPPGCLAVLLGQQTVQTSYYVVTFRRPAS